MGLALVFINLLVYIICSETHTLQRARRKRQCISYPCAPDQTSVPPCPSECCASEAMIPCNSGPPPAPTSQCPCGCCCESQMVPEDTTAPCDKVTGALFLWNSKPSPQSTSSLKTSATKPPALSKTTPTVTKNSAGGNQPLGKRESLSRY